MPSAKKTKKHLIPHCALITGASSGIGEAFANILAEQGFNLVLTARRKDKLAEIAEHLRKKYAVHVEIVGADLANPKSPEKIYNFIKRKNIEIEVFVNNAGYGIPNMYRYSPWSKHRDFLEVMVVSVSHLVYLIEKDMLKRGFGRIINVASIVGLIPSVAGHTLYGAAKAYMIKFTQSHAHELENKGITVTAVCPGLTYSGFHDVTGTRERVEQMPKFMWMSAEEVARAGYSASMMGKVIFVPGIANKLLVLASKYLPDSFAYYLFKTNLNKFRSLEPEDVTDMSKAVNGT